MRQWEYYSAVFGIIKNEKWEILFQRRANTGFSDWLLQLPAGHLEWEEFFKEALIREMKEEINIDIK
jgi:8-oxo-dGTP pyrophosphatase MutT (NUDIX family)